MPASSPVRQRPQQRWGPLRTLTLARLKAATLLLVLLPSSGLRAAPVELSYAGSQRLPEVVVNGRPALIHVQGLYVTQGYFYVTGRLERDTRRALFLAFDRRVPDRYDVVDITPTPNPPSGNASATTRATSTLDHPGGFDFDGRAFWIPIAVSAPRGPTAVVRLELRPDQRLSKWPWRIAFRIDDHIGALAWDATTGRLYGANWDTRQVYAWSPDGKQLAVIARADMVKDQADWSLAVQDWKGLRDSHLFPPGTLVAGGIDKSPNRDAAKSSAVVEWLDPAHRKRLAQVRLSAAPHHPITPTREGLAWHDDELYLLPADLGRGATILRYRCH